VASAPMRFLAAAVAWLIWVVRLSMKFWLPVLSPTKMRSRIASPLAAPGLLWGVQPILFGRLAPSSRRATPSPACLAGRGSSGRRVLGGGLLVVDLLR
jgi:hypothetical protein